MQGSERPDKALDVALVDNGFLFAMIESVLMLALVFVFAAAILFAYGYLKAFLDYRLSKDDSRRRAEPAVQNTWLHG
ncbi:MAG: hypothetical protein ACR2QH_02600 [Geminicoccaceae bacterium]